MLGAHLLSCSIFQTAVEVLQHGEAQSSECDEEQEEDKAGRSPGALSCS